MGREREGIVAFRGIPFAQPPVGSLRWKEPVPTAESDGVFEAVHNGPSPIQTKLESERASFYEQSEDCLYLNVWTAAGYEGQKRAVMAFIHGRAYGWGGTADPLYDGHNFVAAHPEIVLVTVAYRTGLAGFMDFSAVPGGEAYAKSGNLGSWIRSAPSGTSGTTSARSAAPVSSAGLPFQRQLHRRYVPHPQTRRDRRRGRGNRSGGPPSVGAFARRNIR